MRQYVGDPLVDSRPSPEERPSLDGRDDEPQGALDEDRAPAEKALSFEQLFTQQYEPMVRVAFLMLGSVAEAEDVVQDALARMQLRWSRVDNPGGYLRRSVVNGAYEALRKRQRQQRWSRVIRPETSELGADELSDALEVLSPKQRAVVVLRYYAGCSHAEISKALGMRNGTVKSTLHRALARLREVIEQ